MKLDPHQFLAAALAVIRDPVYRMRFGATAPRVSERIWIRPRDVRRVIGAMPRGLNRWKASGHVLDFAARGVTSTDFEQSVQYRSSVERWVEQRPWQDTADFRYLVARIRETGRSRVGCRNEAELAARFEMLDQVFADVETLARMKTRSELNRLNFREFGGVQIAVGPGGEPMLGKAGGYHRLAIAKILDLDVMPAEIGLIDVSALALLDRLRVRPAGTRPRVSSREP